MIFLKALFLWIQNCFGMRITSKDPRHKLVYPSPVVSVVSLWLACVVMWREMPLESLFFTSLFTSLLSLGHCSWKPWRIRRGETLWNGRLSFPSSPVTLLFAFHSSKVSVISIWLSPTSAAPPSVSQLKRQNKKWLSLPRDNGPRLQCKLIWKADAHTSYFTHQNTKLIILTPAQPWVANLVWGLPTLLMNRHTKVFPTSSAVQSQWISEDRTLHIALHLPQKYGSLNSQRHI